MTIHNFRHLLFMLLFLLCSQGLNAQHLQATLTHYTTDDGLPSNAISHMKQDDFGYIWISTWNGLARFDGYQFTTYVTGAASHIPNLHNRIADIEVDGNQNIWMRMYDGRVFVVKRSIDKIVDPFEDYGNSEDILTFHPLMVTSSGYVLINAEGKGLYKVNYDGKKFHTELITTGDLTVSSMAEGYQNDIWLGTDKGVHRMDISNLTIERKGLFLDENVTCLYSNGYNIYAGCQSGRILSFSYGQEPKEIKHNGTTIESLFVDSHGIVWFTDARTGAVRLKPDTGDEKLFTQHLANPDMDAWWGFFEESNGIVWARMNKGGFGYYNRETDEIEYFHNDPSNPWNLSNTVNAVLALDEGVLFESTNRRSLEKLEIMRKTIERRYMHPEEGSSARNETRAIFYDKERKWLLIGNKANELFIYKDNVLQTTITHDNQGTPFGRIYGINKDSKGNYWISAKGNGVFCLTPTANGQFTTRHFVHDEQNQFSLNHNGAYITVEDNDGNIWVATYGGGVNVITKEKDKNGKQLVYNLDNVTRKFQSTSHRKVRTMALDKDGNVWAGSSDGILICSFKDKQFTINPLQASEKKPDDILLSKDIVVLARDPHGDMWVGTNSGGLAHAYAKDEDGRWLFKSYGVKDGLPGEEIHSITFDNRGTVWFATDHQICSFDTDKNIFAHFSSLDGVDETMCSECAATALPNGDLLFGTIDGYYYVERQKLMTGTANILKLRITDFWVDGELQSPRLNDTYDYYVPESKSVRLPDHNVEFAFRFAALNYQLQHRIHYQYMLEGYDTGWQTADKTRTATYSNLPAGCYRFKVKAFLLESPEKYDLRQIEVVVPPYFLLSRNAVWLYMFLAIVISLWLLFYRQRQLAKIENIRQLHLTGTAEDFDGDDEGQIFMRIQYEYLDIHISDPHLTVSELAEVSEMDPSEYAAELYRYTHMQPKEFVNSYRLRRAVNMLEQTDDSITDIAFKCGYSDIHAFNRRLSSKIGMTPAKYRDQYRAKHKKEEQEEQPAENTTDAEIIIES